MFEKVRQPWRAKNIVAYVLFGAIILVFALFGVKNMDGNMGGGGTAAIVNNTGISIAEFRKQVDMMEKSSRLPFDKLPPEQREMYSREIQRRTLEQMIAMEIIYQSANKYGVRASNSQIRDTLMGFPAFQEDGKFTRTRYEGVLAQNGMSTNDFEQQLRKDIVIRKMQGMFQTANTPATIELDHLTNMKGEVATIKYLDVSPSRLQAEKAVTDQEVAAYLKDAAKLEGVKKYYDDHKLDYSLSEKVKARHILKLVDEKNPDKEVAEKIKAIRTKVTPSNFASIAEKESQDPGSAKKGGDLGLFEKGRMVPQFEEMAFKLKPGEISEPVKTDYGYHIIFVEEHNSAKTVSLDEAKGAIARKLIAQAKVPEVTDKVKKAVESGKGSEVESLAKQLGLKWETAEDIDLTSSQVGMIRDPQEILSALAKQKGKKGLVPSLVGAREQKFVVDVTGWKPAKKPISREDLGRALAYQLMGDSFETWVKDAESKASIKRNPRLAER